MGIQDRDWYREEMRQRHAKEQASAAPASQRSMSRQRVADNAGPPKLWGADWHWSLQLLVWLAIAALLLVIWRIVR